MMKNGHLASTAAAASSLFTGLKHCYLHYMSRWVYYLACDSLLLEEISVQSSAFVEFVRGVLM